MIEQTPNKERGEVLVTLQNNGKPFPVVLRPTYECLLAIEEKTGKTMVQLLNALVANALTMRHAAVILCEGHRAFLPEGKIPPTTDAIGQMLYAVGILSALDAISEFLFNALNGGTSQTGEAQATIQDQT